MTFQNDPLAWAEAQTGVIDGLRQRLESIEALSGDVRRALVRADTAAIEDATARVETLAQEFKLLAEEYGRLTRAGAEVSDDFRVAASRAALCETTLRLARSSAVAGGLLARMVQLSRGLLSVLSTAREGTYLPTGRAPELAVEGIRLREQA
jgi:hypothetical protein